MDHQIILQDLQTILIITIITTQSQVAIVIQDQVIITQDQVTMGISHPQDLHRIVIPGQVTVLHQAHLFQEVEVECHLVLARREVVSQEDNFKIFYYEI